eukprot:TRINITY_DN3457_c0_g1_i4.p1 TRINITY_DN3457_c0_g1~~TRINITY_DN3457_c0_g1_i4.p1  ORF type:complete len:237 (+),score=61.90 TRINITY_DN3457_c0_g1_i4:137-847(+)
MVFMRKCLAITLLLSSGSASEVHLNLEEASHHHSHKKDHHLKNFHAGWLKNKNKKEDPIDILMANSVTAPPNKISLAKKVNAGAAAPAPATAGAPASAPGAAPGAGPADSVPPVVSTPAPPSLEIDTDLPYGELAPFGRESTAMELTEKSMIETNKMIDDIEKAEVAEEKRSVFRALTRLRGAAITSFDGVAKDQTSNIDSYSKQNKWRAEHPVKHLADEEADVQAWAFPSSADFL